MPASVSSLCDFEAPAATRSSRSRHPTFPVWPLPGNGAGPLTNKYTATAPGNSSAECSLARQPAKNRCTTEQWHPATEHLARPNLVVRPPPVPPNATNAVLRPYDPSVVSRIPGRSVGYDHVRATVEKTKHPLREIFFIPLFARTYAIQQPRARTEFRHVSCNTAPR